MGKIKLNLKDLENHLREQIEFLKTSCDLFDNGNTNEYKRIALILRILFHDTNHSKSLLGQIEGKPSFFYSTNLPIKEESLLSHFGIVLIGMKGLDTIYYPKLDEMPFSSHWLPFDEWWEEIIFRDMNMNLISRRQLVTTITNQDGGAHVDDKIDEIYYNLSRNNSLNFGIFLSDMIKPIPNAEKAALRQIGHEVLKTLDTNYHKTLEASVDVWIAAAGITVKDKAPLSQEPQPVGRNEACPCGSGKKYKKCHGI